MNLERQQRINFGIGDDHGGDDDGTFNNGAHRDAADEHSPNDSGQDDRRHSRITNVTRLRGGLESGGGGGSIKAILARLDALEATVAISTAPATTRISAAAGASAAAAAAEGAQSADDHTAVQVDAAVDAHWSATRAATTASEQVAAAVAEEAALERQRLDHNISRRLWALEADRERVEMVLELQTEAERERAAAADQLAEVREVGEAMAAQLGRVADEFIGAMSLVTEHLRPVLPPSTLGAPLDSRPLATTTNESSTLLRHQHGLTQLAERVNQGVRMANTAVSEARALASRLEAAQLAAGTGAGGQQQQQQQQQQQETDERYLQSQMHLAHARQLEADARLHHSAASETFEQHLQKLVAEQVKSTLASERVLEARRRGMSRSHNWRARTYDTATVHAAATRLQAAHRGRSSRKKTKFLIAMRMTRQPGGLTIETPSLPALMRRRMLEQEAAHMELFAQRRLTQALQVGQVMKANQPKKAPAGAGNQGSKRPARK